MVLRNHRTSTVLGSHETRFVKVLVSMGLKLSWCWAVIGDFVFKKKLAGLDRLAASSIIKYICGIYSNCKCSNSNNDKRSNFKKRSTCCETNVTQ
jgi:hypothetical protein